MRTLAVAARVARCETGDSTTIVLDRSPFHPQGGGQPADHGVIRGPRGSLRVHDVRSSEADVLHIGELDGELAAGEDVQAFVDESRRQSLSLIHTAGHVVDMAVMALGYGWSPGKGYHFPDGPYVEYRGQLTRSAAEIIPEIEREMRAICERNPIVEVRFLDPAADDQALRLLASSAATPGDIRVIHFGGFGIPCGGTHVESVGMCAPITIRKVREKSGTIRVSYAVK